MGHVCEIRVCLSTLFSLVGEMKHSSKIADMLGSETEGEKSGLG